MVALLLLVGVLLLTSREGYPPADTADRPRRLLLRLNAAVPLLAFGMLHLDFELGLMRVAGRTFDEGERWSPLQIAAVVCLTALSAPLPFLLFRQLRSLAVRARSAHLAEHCTIVGAGSAGALLYVGFMFVVLTNAERWGLGSAWQGNSKVALVLMLVMSVCGLLFLLWSVYLLVRFAISFRRAARQLRVQWRRDDRAVVQGYS